MYLSPDWSGIKGSIHADSKKTIYLSPITNNKNEIVKHSRSNQCFYLQHFRSICDFNLEWVTTMLKVDTTLLITFLLLHTFS